MSGELISPVLAMAVNGFEGVAETFGSPAVLPASAAAPAVIGFVEPCIRKRTKPREAI